MCWVLYSRAHCLSVFQFSHVQLCTVWVSISIQSSTIVYSVGQYTRYGPFSSVQCMSLSCTVWFSAVQYESVRTYSVFQYCTVHVSRNVQSCSVLTVQVSRNLQWFSVMYSIYHCSVQWGTVFVQSKLVKDRLFSGMSVSFWN